MAKQSGGPSDYTNNAGKLTGIGDRKEPPLTEFGSFPARPSALEGRQVRASQHFDRRYLVSQRGRVQSKAVSEASHDVFDGLIHVNARYRQPDLDIKMWNDIETAPFDRDLELAVVEGDHVYPLVFACRRTLNGWSKASTGERIAVSPTHWRLWSKKS